MRNSSAAPDADAELPLVTAPPATPEAGEPREEETVERRDVRETREQREHLRFDKVFPVRVESILFGESACVARNVSAGGIFLETRDPLPLGSRVRVCFLTPDEATEIVALGEVKNHYFLNYAQGGNAKAVSGMAVRFLGFEEAGQKVLHDCLDRLRILH